MQYNSVSVSSQPMILKEGVIANNEILSYEEFYNFMKERLTDTVINQISIRFGIIISDIQAKRIKKAYKAWEKFQTDILLNPNYFVSLLFIENINSQSGNYQYKYNSKEYDILSDRGQLTRLSQLNQEMIKEHLQEEVSEHLHQLLVDVEKNSLSYELISNRLFIEANSKTKRNGAYARWHTHNWAYKQIFYGDNPAWQGNVADAFMNHLAHMHVQLLAGNISDNEQRLFAHSVFQEEGDNIYDLLYAAKNNTPWFSGGDIVIKYQNQIINIQLKTGQMMEAGKRRSNIGGGITIKRLLAFMTEMKEDLRTKNIDNIIQKMYNELKTSGWVEYTNQIVSKIPNDLVDQILVK